jgi:hypothetical protein
MSDEAAPPTEATPLVVASSTPVVVRRRRFVSIGGGILSIFFVVALMGSFLWGRSSVANGSDNSFKWHDTTPFVWNEDTASDTQHSLLHDNNDNKQQAPEENSDNDEQKDSSFKWHDTTPFVWDKTSDTNDKSFQWHDTTPFRKGQHENNHRTKSSKWHTTYSHDDDVQYDDDYTSEP